MHLQRFSVPLSFYRPQTKFAKVMFLQVSVCPQGGRAWLLRGGRAWLLQGGMRGCSQGGHAWLLPGGHAWLPPGGAGGMHGCSGGACVVALGGHAWLLWGACIVAPGGVHVCSGGACMVFFDEIQSMSGWYASYWNAFFFPKCFVMTEWWKRYSPLCRKVSKMSSCEFVSRE